MQFVVASCVATGQAALEIVVLGGRENKKLAFCLLCMCMYVQYVLVVVCVCMLVVVCVCTYVGCGVCVYVLCVTHYLPTLGGSVPPLD